ncbi:ribonuclease H-like [Solea senegalensis]|uniref:Ribonuclease H-like n=1 Tax=Solea senegalensis TaxID=28829 RepID=A0AAV6S8L3_SOLSE|nr:ribonuclease H-like [Solea senegalensis]
MKNARNKEVKHSELFLTCDGLVTGHGITLYWKKVKGHSRIDGPDKEGNDEADRLAKLGAEQGPAWEFNPKWLPVSQTCTVYVITRRQAREQTDYAQVSGQAVYLGRKPDDGDLVAMQQQDPALQTIRELIKNPVSGNCDSSRRDGRATGSPARTAGCTLRSTQLPRRALKRLYISLISTDRRLRIRRSPRSGSPTFAPEDNSY